MTREEERRFDELCSIPVEDITDEEWEEFVAFSAKVKAEYNTAALNFVENYFFEA